VAVVAVVRGVVAVAVAAWHWLGLGLGLLGGRPPRAGPRRPTISPRQTADV